MHLPFCLPSPPNFFFFLHKKRVNSCIIIRVKLWMNWLTCFMYSYKDKQPEIYHFRPSLHSPHLQLSQVPQSTFTRQPAHFSQYGRLSFLGFLGSLAPSCDWVRFVPWPVDRVVSKWITAEPSWSPSNQSIKIKPSKCALSHPSINQTINLDRNKI